MRIQRQRASHPACERIVQDEVEGAQCGQAVAGHLAAHAAAQVSTDSILGEMSLDQRIILQAVNDDRDVRVVALVSGSAMGHLAQLHSSRLEVYAWVYALP